MGVTAPDLRTLENLIRQYQPRKVIDLGAQNNYSQGGLPAPYMSEWWKAKDIEYEAIDMSGENGSHVLDLSQDQDFKPELGFDFVMDFGTSEHVGTDGKFSWPAIYNCWKNKHDLLKVGGIMVNENPKTLNWPGHGFNYYNEMFYYELCKMSGYTILGMGQIAAMGNTTDGWNVFAALRKFSGQFPPLAEFKTLPLMQI